MMYLFEIMLNIFLFFVYWSPLARLPSMFWETLQMVLPFAITRMPSHKY